MSDDSKLIIKSLRFKLRHTHKLTRRATVLRGMLQALLNEAERANEIALRECGVGFIDIKVIGACHDILKEGQP